MSDAQRYENPRVLESADTDPCLGTVRWNAGKSLWLTGMVLGWLIGGIAFFSWDAAILFLVTSAVTLCGGHSLGMHRKLIHGSFDCPDWLEKLGVYLGTLVGLGGPFTMMHTHDIRDWAQRQQACHDFFTHRSAVLRDAWWQMHCKLHLDHPPGFRFPDRLSGSRFFRFLEATAMMQQVPWAVLFFLIGGLGWVAWGVCGRVAISIIGHWLIGYFAHNRGQRDWHVTGAATQGYNVRFCGLITFGECWHNNHHAFPGSARIGLRTGQADPGWWVLKGLEATGLVSSLRLPIDIPPRPELARVPSPLSRP
jgi:fatty-acid desaturase